jgi:hypothetical protein
MNNGEEKNPLSQTLLTVSIVFFNISGCGGKDKQPSGSKSGSNYKPADKKRQVNKRSINNPNCLVILIPLEKRCPRDTFEIVMDSGGTFHNINWHILDDVKLKSLMRSGDRSSPCFVKIIIDSEKDVRVETLASAIATLCRFADPRRSTTIFVRLEGLSLDR